MTADSPRITIGLPVYNGESTLNRAIESLLGQTWPNLELVISNNASGDATASICEAWAAKDPRVRVIHQPKTSTCTENFQFVLDQAQGKYFMWAAADDWWDPRFVEWLIQDLEQHPYAHVAMCSLRREYDNGELMDIIAFHRHKNPNKMSKTALHFALLSGELYHFWISGVFRTETLKPMCHQSILPVSGADRWLMVHFALCSKFRYVSEMLFVKSYDSRPLSERYPGDAHLEDTFGMYVQTGILLARTLMTSPWLSASKKALIPVSIAVYYWVYGRSYLQHQKNLRRQRQKRVRLQAASSH